jgi:hypothetical protein
MFIEFALPFAGASFVKVTLVYLLRVAVDAVGNVYGVVSLPPLINIPV